MRTLQEQQLAMLSVADTRGRADRGVPCVVVAVSRAYVALYPLAEMRLDSVPATIGEVYLSFHQGNTLVALRGVAQALSRDDVRFCPIDVVQLCKRRSSRLQTSATVDLMQMGPSRTGGVVSTESVDVSATGLLLVRRGGFDVGDLVKFQMTFDDDDIPEDDREPVEGVARVLRNDSMFAALDFKDVDAHARRRLTEHIITVKRRELETEVRQRVAREDQARAERVAAEAAEALDVLPLRRTGSRAPIRLVR